MKPLDELVDLKEPALILINEWLCVAQNDCVLLPPSTGRGEVLVNTQLTTRSPLGAIAYETGGVLIDHGWRRFPGSGHPSLRRALPDWNRDKAGRCYFIANDAVGGFYAINGGAFGSDLHNIYYWPPDSLECESLDLGFSEFLHWALTGDLGKFYSDVRGANWIENVSAITGDQCFDFYPPLWTKEGSAQKNYRGTLAIEEAFTAKVSILSQLSDSHKQKT
jgi:hypothetical protein